MMKRTFNFIVIAILAISFFNVKEVSFLNDHNKVAIINFKTEVIDYGKILQHSNGSRTFIFTNTGQAPLIINSVKSSCGCSVPSYSKKPILPGDSGEIEINYSTSRLGNFTKTVTVFSNAEGGNKILKIKGNVVASVE